MTSEKDDAAFASADGPGQPLPDASRTVVDVGEERTIAFAQAGRGPDLLAIHGMLMTLDEMWLGPVPALARHFRVTAIDRPGHGLSRRRRLIDASPWRQAELIHAAVTKLGLRRPLLLGHSYGGTVALAYAQMFPETLSGVLALAPLCRPEPRIEQVLFGPRATPGLGLWLSMGASATTDRMLLPLLRRAIFLPQSVPARFADRFRTTLTDTADMMTIEGEDSIALAPALMRFDTLSASLKVPVRFLGGTADLVVNNALHGLTTASLLPNARFAWIAGAGHMLHHFAIGDVVAHARALIGSAHEGAEHTASTATVSDHSRPRT